MLVLSRKESQRIQVGDDVLICVVAIDGDRVRIGIEAPREVRVMRTELLDRREESEGSGERDDRAGD